MAKISISLEDFKLMREFIEQSCGITLGDNKEYLVETRLSDILSEAGCKTYKELYIKAKKEPRSGLRDKIVDAMTTNETLWFRDKYPFNILKSVIFPIYSKEFVSSMRRNIRIWCAACSTGQEPYSAVMTLMEYAKNPIPLKLDYLEVLATDISPSALYIANAGLFDDFAIGRGMPPVYQKSYFKKKGRFWSITDEVKKPIRFKRLNLQDSFMSLGKFDIVFCRNVAIYFSDQFKKELFEKIVNALNKGGYLFLGASESMRGHSNRFHKLTHNGGVYYQLKE